MLETIWECSFEVKCCCSVTQLCPTLCDPMGYSTPVFPVLHHLLDFAQTHVHWVHDAIQPSHPLLFPSPALNLFQHLCFSSELALSIRWLKFWNFSFSFSLSNEYSGLISFRVDCFDLFAVQGSSRVFSSTTVWRHQFFSTQPFLLSSFNICTWLSEKP